MEARVHGYNAFLRGQRVTYFGRTGDQHLSGLLVRNPKLTDFPLRLAIPYGLPAPS